MCDFQREGPGFTLRIKVTRDHISRGEPKSVSGCPIALALLDALPIMNHHGNSFLSVGSRAADIPIKVPGVGWVLRWYRHFNSKLPESAQKFIEEFDSGHLPDPFEFDLSLEQERTYE